MCRYLPLFLQAAFSDKVCIDEARLYMGEWGAAFGRQEANHTGEFMGIAPTGKRVQIRYMDFWKVVVLEKVPSEGS